MEPDNFRYFLFEEISQTLILLSHEPVMSLSLYHSKHVTESSWPLSVFKHSPDSMSHTLIRWSSEPEMTRSMFLPGRYLRQRIHSLCPSNVCVQVISRPSESMNVLGWSVFSTNLRVPVIIHFLYQADLRQI